jgi:hypothetical protein
LPRLLIALAVCGLAALAGCAKDDAQHSAAAKPGKPAPVGGIGGTGFASNGMGGTGMAQEQPGGVGGTGLADQQPGGIGGTGLSDNRLADQRPGGIGGTGLSDNGLGGTGLRDWGTIGAKGSGADGLGGTGIVGIVTGFGSILVNGLEVALDAGTTVELGGAPATPGVLAVGQLAAIQAEGRAGALTARNVSTAPLLEGPVQAADRATGMLTVLGQRVHIGAGTLLPGKDFPAVGEPVRVNGLLRGDGTLEAASVTGGDRSAPVRLTGVLAAQGDGWSVAGVPVILAAGGSAGNWAGQPVVVTGTWDGSRLQAAALQPDPVAMVLARVAQVSIQGYLTASAKEGTIQVGGVRLRVNLASAGAPGATAGATQEQLVVLTGTVAPDHSITVTGIRVLEHVLSADAVTPPAAGEAGGPRGNQGQPPNPQRPFFAGSGNPWGGPPTTPPKGPPLGVPGGPPPVKGPPCGAPPCGGPPPGKGH